MRTNMMIIASALTMGLVNRACGQLSFSGIPYQQAIGSGTAGLPTMQEPGDLIQVGRLSPGPGFNPQFFSLPVSAFASQQDLNNGLTELSNGQAQLNNTLTQLTSAQNQLANMINQQRSRDAQGAALAGAMTIISPNNGDRFSLTISGAGFDGEGAGAVTVTYRPTPWALMFVGYARSSDLNMAKGGVSFSFP